ncbi:TPA: DUF5406 family protein [Enterococcus faecium]
MANEIVKYHHELNTIPLRKFTPVEMNLFFSIVSRMREKGDKTVRFTFDQLKDLSNYKATANVRFVEDLKATYEKILSLRFGRRSESGLSYDMFVMFTEFKINGDVENPYVDIRIYEKALPLLNNLDEWVRYSLQRWDYKGFVTFRRGGNCKGLDVLALDEDDLYDQTLTDNPIGFGLLPEDDEGNEWFKMTLTDDNGDELSVEDTWSYLSDYIVSVEIIEFVADKEE